MNPSDTTPIITNLDEEFVDNKTLTCLLIQHFGLTQCFYALNFRLVVSVGSVGPFATDANITENKMGGAIGFDGLGLRAAHPDEIDAVDAASIMAQAPSNVTLN